MNSLIFGGQMTVETHSLPSAYTYTSVIGSFYGRYNDLVCDYKLSLAHMLNDLFHTIC
jgi:hypothetical protein